MTKVMVTINYTDLPPNRQSGDIEYELRKTFDFKNIPKVSCYIILKNDARDYIPFYVDVITYDPELDIYHIEFDSHEGVNRCYHRNTEKEMGKVVERYLKYGWEVERIK